jgi:nicotinate-nucleotide pyrophosphorylase (carboxylating)
MTRLSDVPGDLLDELRAAGLDPELVWRKLREALLEDLPDVDLDDPTSSSTISP